VAYYLVKSAFEKMEISLAGRNLINAVSLWQTRGAISAGEIKLCDVKWVSEPY